METLRTAEEHPLDPLSSVSEGAAMQNQGVNLSIFASRSPVDSRLSFNSILYQSRRKCLLGNSKTSETRLNGPVVVRERRGSFLNFSMHAICQNQVQGRDEEVSHGGSKKSPRLRRHYVCGASRHLGGLLDRPYRPGRPTSVSSWKWALSGEARAVRQGDLRAGRGHRRSSFPFQGIDCHSPRAAVVILLRNGGACAARCP